MKRLDLIGRSHYCLFLLFFSILFPIKTQAVHIEVSDSVNAGVIWKGQAVSRQIDLTLPANYKDHIGLVVTKNRGGFGDSNVNPSQFQELPIRLKDASGAYTDLYLTLIGTASLYVSYAPFQPTTLYGTPWNEMSYLNAKTKPTPYKHLAMWHPDRPIKGYAETSLTPVLFCKPSIGTRCEIPSGSIKLDPLYIRLYTSNVSLRPADPVTEGGEIQGNISFHRPCTFTVTNTSFTDLRLTRLNIAGLYPGSNRETSIGIRCLDGKREKEKGQVKVNLAPMSGTVPGKSYMARTTKEGVGIVYEIGKEVTRCKTANPYNKDIILKPLSVQDSRPGQPVTKQSTINWGICQYQDAVKPGHFEATINYKLWLE